jgi:stringent starvation protein B
MMHPIQRMIEKMHKEGACPRLSVNLTAQGVSCPDFIAEQWKEELIVDLDPSWPLNLAFESDRIAVDLAFDGYVERCLLPFASIYIVANRSTGEGIVIEENMPDSARIKYLLQQQGKDQRNSGESRRRKRPLEAEVKSGPLGVVGSDPPAAVQEPVVAHEVPAIEPGTNAARPASGKGQDDLAARRRAAFRVIDGGE